MNTSFRRLGLGKFMLGWLGILLLLLVATVPVTVRAANILQTSATIDSLTTSCSSISITGTGSYQQGIGKVAFVLADVSNPYSAVILYTKEFSYNSKPLPKQVTESWSSTLALTSAKYSGTAESGTANTLTDNDAAWTTNQFSNHLAVITGGTGAGQNRSVTSNTVNTLSVTPAWGTIPDSTSVFEIRTPYRVVFQVWGKQAPYSGLSLVAYEGRNFTCP